MADTAASGQLEPAAGAGLLRWGLPHARGVLAATILGSGMAMLDSTVVNVALPRIGHELHASVTGLQWILDGYLLSLASLILVAGSLGDRYGRRKVFLVGVVWFGAASLLCGIAPNTGLLVAARVLQGVGGALLTPGSLAILQSSFARDERARAIGAWSGLSGIAAAVGPLVGGLLVQVWSWRLAFLVNLPVAALCVWLSLRHVPESRDDALVGPPDVLGAVLAAVGLGGVTAALVEAPALGLTNPIVVFAAAVGVASLVAFVVVQARRADPLVPGRLFADRTFVLANALTFLVYAALGGVFLLLVLQVQISLGYPPTAAGLVGLPIPVIMLLLSARSGRLAQRIGPRWQLMLGPLLLAAGMLLMRSVRPGAPYLGAVLPGVLVFGLGLAVVVAPVTATVLAAAPDRYAGVASAVNNAVARTGTLVAVAVLPAVAGLRGADYTNPTALTASWRTALVVCAVAAAVGGLFALGVDSRVLLAVPEAAVPEAAVPEAAVPEAAERVATPQPANPRPGACLSCGVEAPPTYVRPASRTRD